MNSFKKDITVQILGAIIGSGLAILGAWLIFNMTRTAEDAQRQTIEKEKIESSIKATFFEIESNKLLLQKILAQYNKDKEEHCDPIKEKDDKNKDEAKCYILFLLFSDKAWTSLLINGGFNFIKNNLIKSVCEHYVFVQKANYIADKVKYGRYNEFEGEFFIEWCKTEYGRIKEKDFK